MLCIFFDNYCASSLTSIHLTFLYFVPLLQICQLEEEVREIKSSLFLKNAELIEARNAVTDLRRECERLGAKTEESNLRNVQCEEGRQGLMVEEEQSLMQQCLLKGEETAFANDVVREEEPQGRESTADGNGLPITPGQPKSLPSVWAPPPSHPPHAKSSSDAALEKKQILLIENNFQEQGKESGEVNGNNLEQYSVPLSSISAIIEGYSQNYKKQFAVLEDSLKTAHRRLHNYATRHADQVGSVEFTIIRQLAASIVIITDSI